MLGGFVATNADKTKLTSGKITFGDFVRHRLLRVLSLMSLGLVAGSVLYILMHNDIGMAFVTMVVVCFALNLAFLRRLWNDPHIDDSNTVISNPPLATVISQTVVTFL